MKKLLTGIMVFGMLGSVITVIPSRAVNETNGSTSVTYTADQSYTVSIPDSITLNAGSLSSELTLTTAADTAVRIPYNHNLTYKIDSSCIDINGNLTLTQSGSGESAKVVLKKGGQAITQSDNTVFESVAKLASDSKTEEKITVDASTGNTAPLYSGSYTGNITFNISVE